MGNDIENLVRSARDILSAYGRDYAIGAVRGLAVRNMVSIDTPEPTEGFYPIVKVHAMALRELEEIFYDHVQSGGDEGGREELILKLVEAKVWE